LLRAQKAEKGKFVVASRASYELLKKIGGRGSPATSDSTRSLSSHKGKKKEWKGKKKKDTATTHRRPRSLSLRENMRKKNARGKKKWKKDPYRRNICRSADLPPVRPEK